MQEAFLTACNAAPKGRGTGKCRVNPSKSAPFLLGLSLYQEQVGARPSGQYPNIFRPQGWAPTMKVQMNPAFATNRKELYA